MMNDKVTLVNRAGTFECTPYQLEKAITVLLPASVVELKDLLHANSHIEAVSVHWVSELLIMLAHLGVVDRMADSTDARRVWRERG